MMGVGVIGVEVKGRLQLIWKDCVKGNGRLGGRGGRFDWVLEMGGTLLSRNQSSCLLTRQN